MPHHALYEPPLGYACLYQQRHTGSGQRSQPEDQMIRGGQYGPRVSPVKLPHLPHGQSRLGKGPPVGRAAPVHVGAPLAVHRQYFVIRELITIPQTLRRMSLGQFRTCVIIERIAHRHQYLLGREPPQIAQYLTKLRIIGYGTEHPAAHRHIKAGRICQEPLPQPDAAVGYPALGRSFLDVWVIPNHLDPPTGEPLCQPAISTAVIQHRTGVVLCDHLFEWIIEQFVESAGINRILEQVHACQLRHVTVQGFSHQPFQIRAKCEAPREKGPPAHLIEFGIICRYDVDAKID